MNTFRFVIKLLLLHLFITYILVKKLYLGAVGWVELVERSAKKVTVTQVTNNTTFGTRYHINSTTITMSDIIKIYIIMTMKMALNHETPNSKSHRALNDPKK